jgi:hypothetical protein
MNTIDTTSSTNTQPTHSITLNNIVIQSRPSDNFINATQLCKAGGKYFTDWYRLDSTKELVKELDTNLNSNINLVDTKKGRYNSGSWIHPDLVVPLAQWINPTFAIQVSIWINEWRSYSNNNECRFQTALSELRPSKQTSKEKAIQLQLQKELNAEIEVQTPAGYIDLLTDDKLIEIKEISNWKHAIGQVISYGYFYPNKQMHIYLFDIDDEVQDENTIQTIKRVCEACNIQVSWI